MFRCALSQPGRGLWFQKLRVESGIQAQPTTRPQHCESGDSRGEMALEWLENFWKETQDAMSCFSGRGGGKLSVLTHQHAASRNATRARIRLNPKEWNACEKLQLRPRDRSLPFAFARLASPHSIAAGRALTCVVLHRHSCGAVQSLLPPGARHHSTRNPK